MIKFNGALLRYKSGKHWEKKLFLKKYFNFSWQSNENDCHWYWSLHWFFVICFELSCFIVKKNYFFSSAAFSMLHLTETLWRCWQRTIHNYIRIAFGFQLFTHFVCKTSAAFWSISELHSGSGGSGGSDVPAQWGPFECAQVNGMAACSLNTSAQCTHAWRSHIYLFLAFSPRGLCVKKRFSISLKSWAHFGHKQGSIYIVKHIKHQQMHFV